MRVGINNTFRLFTACGQGQYLIRLLPALYFVDDSIQYIEIGPDLSDLTSGERVRKSFTETRWELIDVSLVALRHRIDILHNPYWTSPILPYPRTVVTVHDIIPNLRLPGFDVYRSNWKSKAYYSLISQTTKYAGAIITDSKASALDIQNILGINTNKIHVIYLAPDKRFYQKVEDTTIEKFCKYFGLNRPYILFVASGFDYRKNVIGLMEAFERVLLDYDSEIMLVITGDLRNLEYPASNDPRPLVSQKKLEGLVKFTGYIRDDDMPILYQGAHICVFPSLYEGGGLAMLEAMASGKPILASNQGALPELGGKAAEFVDPMDWQQIADSLLRLLQDQGLRQELSYKAQERSRQFSWEQTARETVEVYKQVVSRT